MSSGDSLPPAADDPVPPGICPLCGVGNACAMAGGSDPDRPCWCMAVSFSDALLARVPPAARGRACICAACAAAALEGRAGD